MDVHSWAEQMVETLSDQEVHAIVADGAEDFLDAAGRNVPPGFDGDDRQRLVEEVERICRARAGET